VLSSATIKIALRFIVCLKEGGTPMGVALRTTLFLTFAAALAGCGESFSSNGTAGAGGSGGSGGDASTAGGAGPGGGIAGATTTGGGGAGGAPCDDTDQDGDGLSECAGDCDDTVASIHPGAIEICGDDVDQDCDGQSELDPPCNGLGTFVSQKTGTFGALGTMKDPVATIGEGLANAEAISALAAGEPTAVVVAAGDYVEDLVLSGKISLLGGFDPDDWSQREPEVFTTTIKNTKVEGLKIIGTEQPMVVDGFAIQGRVVTSGTDTSVAVTIDGGEPRLTRNVIDGGQVNVGDGASIGVRVITETAAGDEATLQENVINAGTASGGGSYGISVESASMTVVLDANQVTARQGTESVALLITAAEGVEATVNYFQAGTATGGNNVDSSALGVWAKAGKLVLDSNFVNPDQVFGPPDCFTPDVWCGGVRVSTPEATLINNIVYGSSSPRSAALHLLELDAPLAGIVVSSNLFLSAGDSGAATMSAAVLLGSPLPDPGVTQVGRFRNNIFLGGTSENNFGFWEEQVAAESVEPAALDHNLFYFPVNLPNPGVLYHGWNGMAPAPITMIDGLPGDGANLFENPLLVDSHLDPASPCRNKGTSLDGPSRDRDGDDRPQEGEFDIGPDEALPPN
jgi:hypothetical protein